MNAHFRRDYAYLMTIKVRGLDQQIPVRYLKYDRKRKEYIFVEGLERSSTEVQFRFKHTQAMTAIRRCLKQNHIGYKATNYYNGGECNYRLPSWERRKKRLEQTSVPKSLNVTELEIGKVYKFDKGTAKYSFVSNSRPLKVLAKEDTDYGLTYKLRSDDGLNQTCHINWLTTGELVATEVK